MLEMYLLEVGGDLHLERDSCLSLVVDGQMTKASNKRVIPPPAAFVVVVVVLCVRRLAHL